MTINIQDNATSDLREFLKSLVSPEILAAMGRAVKLDIQQHFLSLPPNKMGWPSSGFYKDAAGSVNSRVSGLTAFVSINHLGIAQIYFGGVILPVVAHFLAIPARAEAYGHLPREFDLMVLFGAHGPYALAERYQQAVSFGRARKDGSRKVTPGAEVGGGVMFWLTKEVDQPAHPSVLPNVEEMSAAALHAGEGVIERQKQRSNLQ